MKKQIFISICLAVALCGCMHSGTPDKVVVFQGPDANAAAVPAVEPGVVSFPFKSDIPPSHVIRKNAALWEYLEPGYYIPLATMTDSAKAYDLARQAQTEKAPSKVQQLILGGTPYYRALLGPFKTKKAAEKESKEFAKKKLVDTKLIIEYIKG